MENDIDIEINENSEDIHNVAQLPVNFIEIGKVENDDVKIYIKQDVYNSLEKYASSDTEHELGTILIGDYSENLGKMHIIVSNYIEAKYTDASASTLTFTHETWDYVNKQKEKLYPDLKIVGWQHTHPNYGIFLSNYDLFIQENFFNMPFQTAYVIDPIQNLRGFFQWKNGKTEKLKGFYIYDDIGKTIKIHEKKNTKTEQKKFNITKSNIILSCFLLAAVLACICTLVQKNNIMRKLDSVLSVNEQLNMEIQNNATDNETDKADDAETDTNNINEDENKTDDNTQKTESFIVYTIKNGDTLESICKEHNLAYSENIAKIIKINSIDDTDKIYAGQDLYLPIIQ